MTAPTLVLYSTGATSTGGAWTATGAVGVVGDVVILHVLQDGTADSTVSVTSITNAEDLAGTDNVLTHIGAFDVGASQEAIQHLWIGRLISTSAPVVTGANSGTDDIYWRFLNYAGATTGTTLATVIENVTAGATVNSAGTSATATGAAVTTLGADRLALQFIGVNDDNVIGVLTGWQAAADSSSNYADASGTDGAISVAQMYSGPTNLPASNGTVSLHGTGGTNEEQAQSFQLSGNGTVTSVQLLSPSRGGTPTDDLIVEIQTDASGVPSGTVVGSGGSKAFSALRTLGSVFRGRFSVAVNAALTASTTYWIVLRRSGSRDTVNYVNFALSVAYTGGVGATKNSGTWTGGGTDLNFALSVGTGSTFAAGTCSIVDIDAWGVVGFALIGTTVADTRVPYTSPYPQILAH